LKAPQLIGASTLPSSSTTMSLVPYHPDTSMEPLDFAAPFLMGAVLVLTALASSLPDEKGVVEEDITEPVTIAPPPPKKIKTRCPEEDPLDAEIVSILQASRTPLTVKQITGIMADSQKRTINSRLYKMLSQKKVNQWKTKGAPQWIA
jgi:hypothetical protein